MDLEQVFEYAIDQEIQAREFYEKSAAQTDNAEAAALFRSLARMEAAHRRVLETEKHLLAETGQFEEARRVRNNARSAEVESLLTVTQVLREANVELRGRHKKMEVELETAGQIQEALLPRKVPQMDDLAISVSCSMAARIGGDYYDFMLTPGGNLAMTIADVSGKGLPAAMLMMSLRTIWRSQVQQEEDPGRLLSAIAADGSMDFEKHDQYATMISASYNPTAHELVFGNAGHWPPLTYIDGRKEASPIAPGFLPLGLDGDSDYATHVIQMPPGSVVVFFSDGIIDATNSDRELFGEDRLYSLVEGALDKSADEIRDEVTAAVLEFTKGDQRDDQTIMVLKRAQGPGQVEGEGGS